MLTNAEYAKAFRVPAELSAEMSEFAAFTLPLAKAKGCVGRDKNGKRIVKQLAPKGKGNLFDVVPVKSMTLKQARELAAKEGELDRQAKLALYISRGYAFDEQANTNPHDGAEELTADEMEELSAELEAEYEAMGHHEMSGTRKGGISNHSSFEGFVDSAQ